MVTNEAVARFRGSHRIAWLREQLSLGDSTNQEMGSPVGPGPKPGDGLVSPVAPSAASRAAAAATAAALAHEARRAREPELSPDAASPPTVQIPSRGEIPRRAHQGPSPRPSPRPSP